MTNGNVWIPIAYRRPSDAMVFVKYTEIRRRDDDGINSIFFLYRSN